MLILLLREDYRQNMNYTSPKSLDFLHHLLFTSCIIPSIFQILLFCLFTICMLLIKLFNKVPVPTVHFLSEPSKIENPAETNRPELSFGAPLGKTKNCFPVLLILISRTRQMQHVKMLNGCSCSFHIFV